MKCEICGQGPENGTTIHRTGKKGPNVNPHWRCEFHVPSSKPIDSEIQTLVAIIEKDNESYEQ